MNYTPLTISRMGAAVVHLTHGCRALVDVADWPEVSRWKWHRKVFRGRFVYAAREKASGKGRGRTSLMHREIVGAAKGVHVDHWNHRTLDNRRCNLRVVSNSENHQNRLKRCGPMTSRFVGVHRAGKKFVASIKINQRRIHLGTFATEEDAARARDAAAKVYFTNARLNLPEAESA